MLAKESNSFRTWPLEKKYSLFFKTLVSIKEKGTMN